MGRIYSIAYTVSGRKVGRWVEYTEYTVSGRRVCRWVEYIACLYHVGGYVDG